MFIDNQMKVNKIQLSDLMRRNKPKYLTYIFQIFTKPTDEIALFLLGTNSTDNDLNYKNISLALPMNSINWDILKYVQSNIDPPSAETTADWLDAIIVAMDYFRAQA